jgi:hypothetical protein
VADARRINLIDSFGVGEFQFGRLTPRRFLPATSAAAALDFGVHAVRSGLAPAIPGILAILGSRREPTELALRFSRFRFVLHQPLGESPHGGFQARDGLPLFGELGL